MKKCAFVKLLPLVFASHLIFLACGVEKMPQPKATVKEAVNPDNDPREIDPEYGMVLERRAAALPAAGQASYDVWVADYYPNSEGGTAKPGADGVSPMEKYERASGSQGALKWEKENASSQATISWSGHCNGLAAASVAEEEPRKNVTFNGVVFSTEDIKALLIESWQSSGRTVGLRCDKASLPRDSYGRVTDAECRDLNPATLHLAVTNFIGREGQAVIIDRDAAEPVWNWVVSSYSSNVKSLTPQVAAQLVGAGGQGYVFNSRAKTFWQVNLTLELPASGMPATYQYVLEGDEQGRIFGGEWIGSSKLEHPDFIWRPGRQKAANPYLDYAFVKKLHLKSL